MQEQCDFETQRANCKEQIGNAHIKAMDDIRKILYKYLAPQIYSMLHDMSPWKQLIHYDFDTPMNKDIFHAMIEKVEASGILVVAKVDDLGPTYLGLRKSLDVGIHKSSCTNPAAPDRKIFVFVNGPHFIKLTRNDFLDNGIKLNDKNINSEYVSELVSKSLHDLKTTHRLSHKP